ncbi:type IV secretion system protein VirB7 [Roseomonas nepalensis]|uniref:Type IV secretion system protein VirB7 n=1 Tax=Muricoccus nepalensis TaxID=1854500 RepID=A0A502FT88_9PROT|nr:type IV secretion system lipoprotein VirB7 [Roseomonas nepalensis]TPG52472.1 type IV secretion system protein VirB7 [Roseomonas nepalensis]
MPLTFPRLAVIALLGLLGACASGQDAPVACKGEPFALNAGLWTPTAEDLR